MYKEVRDNSHFRPTGESCALNRSGWICLQGLDHDVSSYRREKEISVLDDKPLHSNSFGGVVMGFIIERQADGD